MECIYNPQPSRRNITFNEWLQTPAYLNAGYAEVTMEEALTEFFYSGITDWMKSCGYSWSNTDSEIKKKFLNFAFAVSSTLEASRTATLQVPFPNHRNLPDDRDTFDLYADMSSFTEFLHKWSFRSEIVGTRLDHLIREFCYTWSDVEKGKPGRWTQLTINMNEDENSDDDKGIMLPDGNWSRRKYDLY